MIIGVCGNGYTGSGAVMDFLKERSDFQTVPIEFNICYLPHGIQDLDWHLNSCCSRYYSSDIAIKDFISLIKQINTVKSVYKTKSNIDLQELTKKYINNITQVYWNGWWSYDIYRTVEPLKTFKFRILLRIKRVLKSNNILKVKKCNSMYLSINPDNFVEETKGYIRNIIGSFNCDMRRPIFLNQPFEANAPWQSMKYFDNAKAIVVERDPRDVYLYAKNVAKSVAEFIPTQNVDSFIKYYKLTIPKKNEENTDVLYIRFEDLVYEYENTIKKINNFLNLPDVKIDKYKYFDPKKSINNTQLFLTEKKLNDDIRIIERELKDFLYDFDKYSAKPNNKPFIPESD